MARPDLTSEQILFFAERRIKALETLYAIRPEDVKNFERESPKILEAISQIEGEGPKDAPETRALCIRWVANYHALFKRRAFVRNSR